MSTLKDIVDTLSDVKGEVVPYIQSGRSIGSLSKASQSSILNFPVIVSNTISIEDASLINKALEKQFASFLLTVTTMDPYLIGNTETDLSAKTYVRRIHQNMDNRFDNSDLSNLIASRTESLESYGYEELDGTDGEVIYRVYENMEIPEFNTYNAKYNYTAEDVTNSEILNNYGKRTVMEAGPRGGSSLDEFSSRLDNLTSALGNANNQPSDPDTNDKDKDKSVRLPSNGVGMHSFKDVKHLMDNDVKKANELVPTLLHIRIFPMFKGNKGTTELQPLEIVLGVKATLHPVDTEEMVTNIARGLKSENVFFNFIRWTTGEIKFFKDFLFTVNDLKLDAVNDTSKGGSRWWTMLKRRRALAKLKNKFSKNKFIPNATIVMTQEEVNNIRDAYGYDLNKTSTVYNLMHNYFLISFVIVDPALQRVKFLFDGHNEFETLTYATLARESSTNDKQFKEMLNMMGRRL